MNLTDMATQVCLDTGYLDTDDVTYCKTALRQRDELLWRMGLWKDSLVQVTLTVDPTTNQDHAEGVIYMPEVIERVVAVRTADAALRVNGLETFYRADYDQFSQTGNPVQFAKLAPAWFTYRPVSPITGITIQNTETSDDGKDARLEWVDANGNRHIVLGELSVGGTVFSVESSRIEVLTFSKPATDWTVSVFPITGAAIYTLEAATTQSPKYQRIRIFPIPTASGGLKVLGKAAYAPLTFDQQEPAVTGSHLALMAFAKYSMFKRGGETVPAAEALQEAMGLMETLKREEMQQEAHNQRIIPDSGYGDPFFGPGRDGNFLGG